MTAVTALAAFSCPPLISFAARHMIGRHLVTFTTACALWWYLAMVGCIAAAQAGEMTVCRACAASAVAAVLAVLWDRRRRGHTGRRAIGDEARLLRDRLVREMRARLVPGPGGLRPQGTPA
jgi:hypothetical protein